MPRIRITDRYYELRAEGYPQADDNGTPINSMPESNLEPEGHRAPARYERAVSAEPEDHQEGTSAVVGQGSFDDSDPEDLEHDRAMEEERQRYRAKRSYYRAASVEPEERSDATSYERAASLEPDYFRFSAMQDVLDIPEPAVLRLPHRSTDHEGSRGENAGRRITQRLAESDEINFDSITTLLQGLKQREISVVGRSTNIKEFDERKHDATMLDVSILYKTTKSGLVDEQLLLSIEYVLNENPDVSDRTYLRNTVLERFLVDMGANMVNRKQALRLVTLFAEKHDITAERLVISIPATECGMRAAKRLRNEHACLETGTNILSINHMKTESTASMPTRPDSSWRDVWALGATPGEINAVCALLKLRNSSTKLLISNMRQLDDLAFLPDIHGVILDTADAEKANELRLPFHAKSDEEAAAKAQAVLYPSSYLLEDGALLASLPQSEKDQHVSRFVMSNEAEHLIAYQRKLEEKIEEALAYRIWIRDLDPQELEAMYRDDVLKEDRRQQREEYFRKVELPEKIEEPSPRTNHVGYRMAKTTWDLAFKA
ncbi:uncharacterized protein B0H18DRAFT_1114942 [Fomitopsis serialis]|uniref:uncharacterized protein n=1 Tax=Fomitopsis serialis TaxID=139415 RepID=UPI0020086A6C|nr:uncharacterized protein B0H18DRAFT_1114942 [Neoantrodia serialis]KAH9934200.1 hypothetical protein B0H18DRAFT_1114942 [Neoantrodia serialis]